MKILVVNNHSIHIGKILNKLNSAYSVDFENLDDIDYNYYDAIILSGGSSLSVVNHEKEYKKELELIKNFNGPILGICLGFELINFAFNEEIKRMQVKKKGIINIELVSEDKLFYGISKEVQVYEAHRWVVQNNNFLVSLAKSKYGIEAVRHPKKEIYGVQFHPEIFVKNSDLEKIFENFLKLVN